ncbi:MAG: UbiD family decarboxylase, partial [Planctomycetota bacterium]
GLGDERVRRALGSYAVDLAAGEQRGEGEFALCGRVPPKTRRPEGPFGDHYGYYSLRHDYPVFEVERVYHRKDAIYPATVVGKPRQEDFFIGDYLQKLLSPLFPLVMPSVRSLWSYGETGFHSLAAAVVKDRYPREAMVSAFRILGEGQLSLTKFLLVTDGAVDLEDFPALLEHVLARTRIETDLFVFANLSMDTLDYAGPQINEGSKGVWLGLGDPIRELKKEHRGELPSGIHAARAFCPGCLVVSGSAFSEDETLPDRVASWSEFSEWPLIVLADDVDIADHVPSFLWATFTRFEPAADLHARSQRIVRHHVTLEGPIVLDARMKPSYPDELIPDPVVAARVGERWSELFPKTRVRGVETRKGLPERES